MNIHDVMRIERETDYVCVRVNNETRLYIYYLYYMYIGLDDV